MNKGITLKLDFERDEELRNYIKEMIGAEIKAITRREMEAAAKQEMMRKLEAIDLKQYIKRIVCEVMQQDLSWKANDINMSKEIKLALADIIQKLSAKYENEDYFQDHIEATVKRQLTMGGYL